MNYKLPLVTVATALLLMGASCTSINVSPNVQSNNTPIEQVSDFAVGNSVLALWTTQTWYQATIDSVCESGFNVTYYDGTKKCLAKSDLIKDKIPSASSLTVGTKVIAQWTGTAYYDAEIIKITGQNYTVRYYDNVEKDLLANQMRLDPRPIGGAMVPVETEINTTSTANTFVIGDKILAEWTTNTTLYSANITATCDSGFNVKYYDSYEKCLKTNQIMKDIPSATSSYQVSSKVVAQYGSANVYYPAIVTAISGNNISIKYYDGVTSNLSASQMRLDTRH